MKPLADCRLYGFVDTAYLDGRDPAVVARALGDGGADLIQLRAKDAGRDEVRRLAERVMPAVASAGAWFVLNDDWELGRELGVPCVHVGQEDFFDAGFTTVGALRGRPDSDASAMRVGLSSHAPEQAVRAVGAGADYVAVGPVYPTGTKPGRPAVGLEYVRWAAANLDLPWFAIGGIHEGNLDAVLEAGARRVCVVSAILRAPDIAAACRSLRRRLD